MRRNRVSDPRSGRPGTVERRQRWRIRPTLMALEDRWLLSTIVVNNPTDTPVVGQIDLRQAIGLTNSNPGDDTIAFDSKVFKSPQTISLDPTLGQLELRDTTGTETIMGPKKGVTVSAGGTSRVFLVDPNVTASISGLTITGGSTTGNGAGLYNNGGNVSLTDCTVSGNSTTTTFPFGGGGVSSAARDDTDQLHDQRKFRCPRRRRTDRHRRQDDADQLHGQRQHCRQRRRRHARPVRHNHADQLHVQRQHDRRGGAGGGLYVYSDTDNLDELHDQRQHRPRSWQRRRRRVCRRQRNHAHQLQGKRKYHRRDRRWRHRRRFAPPCRPP